MQLNNIIKYKREELNLSIIDISNILGISPNLYEKYENTTMPIDILSNISTALEIPENFLKNLYKIESQLSSAQTQLTNLETNVNQEYYIEELAKTLGFTLIKDYGKSLNEPISAIIYKNSVITFPQAIYNNLIVTITDFINLQLKALIN